MQVVMAASTSGSFPLPTGISFDGDAGGTTAPGVGTGDDAGASGDSYANSVSLSTGGIIAIVVVVVVVSILGASTAALFFIAKKREWTIKETIRRSARKVVTVLTPRRTEFPDSVKNFGGSSRRTRTRIADDVPPTPRLRPEDVEKGLAQAEARNKSRKWGR
ncbi:hypothetical protein HJFPF1_08913 [Paramyrothecium foliicola]|nr:hypothetical protein HJFPF1_08913 [Paramyrothecium foliicola]